MTTTAARWIIGNNVRLIRKELGLSLLKFSILTELSKATVVNIENSKTGYNLNLLDKIITFTKFSLRDLTNENFSLKNDFRERMIKRYSKDDGFYAILNGKPEISYAIKRKILSTNFLNNPREVRDIRAYLLSSNWDYKGSSISNALKRMPDSITINIHPTKKGTFVYSKKL